MTKIAIIGLGLIGGSIAKCLKKTATIYGVETHQDTINLAKKDGINCVESVDKLPSHVDLIIIATPILETIKQLNVCAKAIDYPCVITDVSSVKSIIFDNLPLFKPGVQFCSGHPMAGAENSGYKSADAALFEGKNYLLIKQANQTPSVILNMLSTLKVAIDYISVIEHDKAMARVSHVPFLLSTLALYDIDESIDVLQNLVGPGFKDLTRIAASNPTWAQEIVMANKDPILDELKRVAKGLDFYGKAIQNNTSLFESFASIRKLRETIFPPYSGFKEVTE